MGHLRLGTLKLEAPVFLIALIAITFELVPFEASAITVEVAKKCNLLLAKEFPPREPGNPAAGSAKGTAQSARVYFNKCVANNGDMNNGEQKNRK